MLKKDVEIGAEVYTRIGQGKARVRVLRSREGTGHGKRKKTVFVVLNLATQRELERGAGALHFTKEFDTAADLNFLERKRVQRTEVSTLDRKQLSAGEKPSTPPPRDLSGDPGYDTAERRNEPPARDTIPMSPPLFED